MLQPAEITSREFQNTFGGYHKADVDEFLANVSADYSELYKKNAVLEQKIKLLVQKVEEYRATEDNMRAALLTAQKRGEEIVAEAQRVSQAMLAEADADIKKHQQASASHLAQEEERLRLVVAETADFVAAAQQIAEKQLSFLKNVRDLKIDIGETAARRAPVAPTKPEPPATTESEPEDDTEAALRKFDFENLKFGYNYSGETDDDAVDVDFE
ncbi:MAG: DivIVA domain-containing protein [Oscillospiraceae bacterium]|jgi:cell division initiation protein|nr:DivIVA domain-containing protein [Oscillospiraceae bacterium]